MKINKIALPLIATLLGANTAQASVVTSFDHAGVIAFGNEAVATAGPGFSPGGAIRSATFDIDTGNPRGAGAAFANGADAPISFSVGSAALGGVSAVSNLLVSIDITNDSATANNASVNSQIFAGGVGVAEFDTESNGCVEGGIDTCTDFINTMVSDPQASASLFFQLAIDGEVLFEGTVTDEGGTFTPGFGLENFGASVFSDNFFTWEETILENIDLGLFEAGETRNLTFLVQTSVIGDAQFDNCGAGFGPCVVARSTFGDPLGDGGSMIPPTAFFSVAFNDPAEVPLPPAAFIFMAGAGLIGWKRRFIQGQ